MSRTHLRNLGISAGLLLLLANIIGHFPSFAAGPSSLNVKAAYLYNFARLATWPAKAFKSPTDPVVIGILGPDPFGAVLDNFLKGKKVGARSVVAKRLKTPAEGKTVHLIYLAPGAAGQAAAVGTILGGSPVIRVGDFPGYCAKGGHLGFYDQAGAVKFEANPGAINKSGLSLNSKLLGMARIVR